MQWWEAVLLGAIQGLTEFLPVSSSGHLLIFEYLFGLQQVPLTFDVLLHLGTLTAVVIFFRQQLLHLSRDMVLKIGLATVPIVIGGLFLKSVVEGMRGSLAPLIVTYAFTAGMLFIADQLMRSEKKGSWLNNMIEKVHQRVTGQEEPSWLQALIVGLFQVLAVLPGISRSGTTVSAGIFSGISLEKAFSFAFIISIPAVLGAVVLDLGDAFLNTNILALPWGLYFLGVVVSGITGWLALYILQWFITKRVLWPFALYAAAVSVLLVFFA